jgi:aspartate dehydrogenase
MQGDVFSVGVIGYGAIGKVVADALHRGEVPGAALAGVSTRTVRETPVGCSLPLPALIERSRLVVECAGHDAVASHGPAVLESGRDLLLVSVGALADDRILESLQAAGPGRVALSTGALGGVDVLRAARLAGTLDRVCLTTTKRPDVLVQSWMDAAEATRLRSARRPTAVFEGSAREAARRFPRSANVAAALALAAGGWHRVTAKVIADPKAQYTGHDIEFSGEAGEYRFTIRNRPARANPATSAVVPHAVLRALNDEASAVSWRFR